MTDRPISLDCRRYDLDWLRVFAFSVLILYHVGMFYVTWDWHIKSRFAGPMLELPMSLINPWRLPLLFFVSGVALRLALTRSGTGAVARGRLARLGLPLLFGFYVVVAPQAYFELLAKGEIQPGFWSFYADYLDFDFEFSILTPTWNHLWFLVYLLVYSLIICLTAQLAKRAETSVPGWLRDRSEILVLAPVPVLIAWEWLLADRFPVTHALVDDWYTHASSFTFMLVGFAAATTQSFWRSIDRRLGLISVAALVLAAIRVALWQNGYELALPDETARAVRIVYAWAAVLTLLGAAQRYFSRRSMIIMKLNRAMLPCYVLHQTLIVTLGAWATYAELTVTAEAALVLGGTVAGCIVGYLVMGYVPALRPLFGLAYKDKSYALQIQSR